MPAVNGDGNEVHWSYSATRIGGPYKVTTTAPDYSYTEQYIHDEPDPNGVWRPYGFGSEKTGRSYEDRVYAAGGTLLRRNLTEYTQTGPISGGWAGATQDMRPTKHISIVFEPSDPSYALATMTETVYDTSGNSDPAYFSSLNPKEIKTYDYVAVNASFAATYNMSLATGWFSGAGPAKTVVNTYLYSSTYQAKNITGLVAETLVKDASQATVAKTQIAYDELNSYSYPLITEDAYSSRWADPGYYRGLPTSTKSWANIGAGEPIETHAQYDQLGNLRKSWDAKGYLTQTRYSAANDHAYPTEVKSPVPDSSGAQGANTELMTYTNYDFNTGLPTSVMDPNGGNTSMSYDVMLRPTFAQAPNFQQTLTTYGAGTDSSSRWVKVRSMIDGSNWKEVISSYDGLGRTTETKSIDSTTGDVYVNTSYDNMGRPSGVTNPYRSGEAVYWTTTGYDQLGRVTSVSGPDGSSVGTSYGIATGTVKGTVVTVSDQAQKQRRSVTNALGQLIRVDEPDVTNGNQLGPVNSPYQATSYQYDGLSNLTTVNQGIQQQPRTFQYDSLSRLKQAVNPESGQINYNYDNNGNLTSKTDPRGTTNYAYDRLNRVVTRSYTDGGVTPNVSYFYDNISNGKGRLRKVSSSVSTTEYTGFDILGRVLSHQQTTDGQTYSTAYNYNLAGALLEETYPSGRVVKNTLDSTGDLAEVKSKKNPAAAFWSYANSFTYNAAGAVTSMRLGNHSWESTQFNSRLQPTMIALGTMQGWTDKLKLDYTYTGGGQSGNNGNVISQQITVKRTGQSDLVFNQNYTYDALNRLSSAEETTGGNSNWKQTYTFDRYGNRNFNRSLTTYPSFSNPNVTDPPVNPANNRLSSGYGYDGAGNVTSDAEGSSFTYDAENKQTAASGPGVTLGQYYFDGDGRRVKKVVPSTGETTIFVYDAGGKLVAEYSTNIASIESAKVAYLTQDNLGTPRINTDLDGRVTSRSDYLPYGEEIIALGGRSTTDSYSPDSVRQGFTGYINDGETGLDFAQARMYANRLGRFNAVDPLLASAKLGNPQTFNRYAYVTNQPTLMVDPSGLSECSAEYSYEECGGDSGEFGDAVGNWKKKSGGLTGETARFAQRIFSIRETGYDRALDRFSDNTQLVMTYNGASVSMPIDGFSLDDVDRAYSAFNGYVLEENRISRRAAVRKALEDSGLINALTLKESGVGFSFEADKTALQAFLDNPDNHFRTGPLSPFHLKDAQCGFLGKGCKDYRSDVGSMGSMQITYNRKKGYGFVDIDRFSPFESVGGFFRHNFIEVLGGDHGSPVSPGPLYRIARSRATYIRPR